MENINGMVVRGYKGFDKDLKCRSFQYEIGKVYEIQESVKLCERGYHFCSTLKGAIVFYPNDGNNRYCEVIAHGELQMDKHKIATNKLEIVREVTAEEICADVEGINLRILRDASANGGIVVGSLALKLQGYDLGRPIKDIDFIFALDGDVDKTFKSFEIAQTGSVIIENKGLKGRRAFFDKEYNKTYDVFLKETTYKEINFYGVRIKVGDPLKIWGEKLRYAFGGHVKHANDFRKFSHKLKLDLLIRDNDDTCILPF